MIEIKWRRSKPRGGEYTGSVNGEDRWLVEGGTWLPWQLLRLVPGSRPAEYEYVNEATTLRDAKRLAAYLETKGE